MSAWLRFRCRNRVHLPEGDAVVHMTPRMLRLQTIARHAQRRVLICFLLTSRNSAPTHHLRFACAFLERFRCEDAFFEGRARQAEDPRQGAHRL